MNLKITALVLACATGTLANAAFVNGDFETGDLSGWTVTLTENGATAAQGAVQVDIDGPGALGTNFAANFSVGRAVSTITNVAGILLTQDMVLTAGVQYTFDFDWAAYRSSGGANTQGGVFDMMVNGVSIASQAAGSTSAAAPKYGHVTAQFTPTTTGTHTVGAKIGRPFTIPSPTAPNLFQAVDNFTMSPVPEPSALLALGAGALILLRRRRK